ncbi:MAG: DNA primase [Pedosphaera sp.]|nr:DNA primase [Pedosphaera sp.]MSU42943.1 DNA primase [Pedosphaera sp.]
MAGLISQAILEQVRAASDIVEVIGGCFPLKRAGANFTAVCPFHKEKTPSFNVNPHKQIFHCFGCHKGGDVFKFVQEYEHIGFLEAVGRLAERASIVIERDASGEGGRRRELKDTLLQLHDAIARRWQTALTNEAGGQLARDYLEKRGVSAEAIQEFRLGSAPESWDDTVNWAKSKSYDLPLVEQAGLIIRKEGTDRYYDRFRGRLIFPICDEQGRVVAFSGRTLDPEAKTAKYVNSPETPLFTKGRVIYGLDKAKRAIAEAGCALICEGQLDLIACHAAGVRHAVAPQGTALTADHARILKRYCEEVVLCFDADNAGQNAAVRSLDGLLAAGLAIRVASVPAPHDPDSFIREHGAEAFRALLEQAEGFYDFHLRRLCEANDVRTDRGRKAVLHAMGEAAQKAGDAVLLDACARKTALALGVSAEAVRIEFSKLNTQPVLGESDREPAPATPAVRPSVHEIWLLRLIFLVEEDLVTAAAHLELEWLEHAAVREIVRRRLEAQQRGTGQGAAAMLGELDAASATLCTEVMATAQPVPEPARELGALVKRLRDRHLDRQLAQLTQQLSRPGVSEAEQVRLLHEQSALRRRKATPLVPPTAAR